MASDGNHWELYSATRGWKAASERLDAELRDAIAALDAAVAGGSQIGEAAKAAFRRMEAVMMRPENARFGAADSEPSHHLAASLTRHLRNRYGLGGAEVDRFGDVSLTTTVVVRETAKPATIVDDGYLADPRCEDEIIAERRRNHWELYSSEPGWEACSARLDAALATAIANLDAAVTGGGTVRDAAVAAWREVDGVMRRRENAELGAGDSEPYWHLSSAITKHIRKRWGVGEASINRYGDPEDFDAPRFGR